MERNWVGTKVRHVHGAVGKIIAAAVSAGNTELRIFTTDALEDAIILNDAGFDRGTAGWEWCDEAGAWRPLGDQNRLGRFKVRLSSKEESMLVQLASTHGKKLSMAADNPCRRTLNSLVAKGLAAPTPERVEWRITPAGDIRARSIY